MKIYISSTFEDLKEEREAVRRALLRLNHEVIGVESEQRSLDKVRHDIAAADIFVLIVALRYGYVPEGPDNPDGLSISHLEYREATARNLNRLVFLLSEDAPWPPRFVDREDRIKRFRDELRQNTLVAYFSNADDLAVQVVTAVARDAQRPAVRPQFNVFLSYNSSDRDAVSEVAKQLQQDGIRVWVDVFSLQPGDNWQAATERAFSLAATVVVFVGPTGIGSGQMGEVEQAVKQKAALGDHFRLIPVILPGASHEHVPYFLRQYTWIEFGPSLDNREAYARLRNAILGVSAPPPEATPPRPKRVLSDQDLQMLPDLLFRLVVRLRERPEMLQSLDATAFWGAVRKVQPGASTIEDLRKLNAELGNEPAPGPLWAAWVRQTRASELASLLDHPLATQAKAT